MASTMEIFGELNNNSRHSSMYTNSSSSFLNNDDVRPFSPISNTRTRSTGFSENNSGFNFNENVVPAAAETIPNRSERERMAETFIDNYWRIINLFLLDPRVLRHVTLKYDNVFQKIPGKSNKNLLKGSQNILMNNTKTREARMYYQTKRILQNLLKELSKKVNINDLEPNDFFIMAFGLTEDEIERKLKELHPPETILLNTGKYSEKFMHVPGRFYKGILDFYKYGNTFLEWRSITDVLSRKILDYISNGRVPNGILSIVSLDPRTKNIPSTNELTEEYILFSSEDKPDYMQNTTTFPILDLKYFIEQLINTNTMKTLFKNRSIIKISPGIRAILESNPEYKLLLNTAFPPKIGNSKSKPMNYSRMRLTVKGAIPTRRPHNLYKGGNKKRSNTLKQRITKKNQRCI